MTLKERYYYILLNLAYWMIHFKVMPMQATKLARYAFYSAEDIWTRQALNKQGLPTDSMINDMTVEYAQAQCNVLYKPDICHECTTCTYQKVCEASGMDRACPHMLVFGG